jgi:replicative superfamily II helicase
LDWQPNDRAIALARAKQSGPKSKQFSLLLRTLHTTKRTLAVPEELLLTDAPPLKMTWSMVSKNSSDLAAASAQVLKSRGPIIVLGARPDWVWSLAKRFKTPENHLTSLSDDAAVVQRYLRAEMGDDFELAELLEYGVGVHHAGLSDEVRSLMELLFESEKLSILVATTTIAQGVNFPVSGLVMAQNKYYDDRDGMKPMPPEDFWNIAGRAGRVDQGLVGIVALAAVDDDATHELTDFVQVQVSALNSTLVDMVGEAINSWGQLELHQLSPRSDWSAFLQYLAHTYRQIGDPQKFATEIEQVLRGTLGFQALRRSQPSWASRLIESVQQYGQRLSGQPLKLVDTTGFSWETVHATLARLSIAKVTREVWQPEQLFAAQNKELPKIMGILLQIPELRDKLTAATGGFGPDGTRLARMVADWVNGATVPEMTKEYFSIDRKGKRVEPTAALTNCCKNLFGKLTHTASWGLAALQSMTLGDTLEKLSEREQQSIRNLPARVFYGVNTDEAIALRMLGVQRTAAQKVANKLGESQFRTPLPVLRTTLAESDTALWSQALGARGSDYYRIWRMLEG